MLTPLPPPSRCRPEFLREVEKREEEEEVVESIEIREDFTLTKQLRQVGCMLGPCRRSGLTLGAQEWCRGCWASGVAGLGSGKAEVVIAIALGASGCW